MNFIANRSKRWPSESVWNSIANTWRSCNPDTIRPSLSCPQRRNRKNWKPWLSAAWGSLPLAGGVEAAYRAEIDAAADPAAKVDEIKAKLEKLRSPFRSAEDFQIEEIIDPRATRPLLCEFALLAAKLREPGLSKFGMRP